jgi:hypothetical protein
VKRKTIKKSVRFFLVFLSFWVVLFGVLYGLLITPVVQTWLTRKITDWFKTEYGIILKVEGVDISFFSNAILEGIYLEDLHNDTLFYADKIKADVAYLNFSEKRTFLSNITVQDAKLGVVFYKNDTDLNVRCLQAKFRSSDTAATSASWDIKFRDVNLVNFDVVYRDERFTDTSSVMDFEDIHCTKIYGKLHNLKFVGDTVFFDINDLAAREKCGFRLAKLTANAKLCPVYTQLDNLHVLTNESDIRTNLRFDYTEYNDYYRFQRKVTMHANFDSSLVQLGDIGYFASELKGLRRNVILSGNVNGKVNNLSGTNMDLVLTDNTRFKGDFKLTGLPDVDETYMYFNIKELTTTKKDVETFPMPPFDSLHYLSISDNMNLLGKVKFKGKIARLRLAAWRLT